MELMLVYPGFFSMDIPIVDDHYPKSTLPHNTGDFQANRHEIKISNFAFLLFLRIP